MPDANNNLHNLAFSGNMYGYLVGAEDRWEYLVAGDPLRQIGSAEPEAKQGEVRVCVLPTRN